MSEITYILSKVELLSALNSQQLSELAEDFHWECYPQGSDIIKQGETEHHFYVLAEGRAESLVRKGGHNSWQVNSFGPGEAFGELSLFTGKAAPTTVRCLENCEVLALDSEHFARMLVRWPIIYAQFAEKLSNSINKVNYAVWEARHKDFLRNALQMDRYEDKFYGIWGSVRTSKEIENKIAELTRTRQDLLLFGERGTGRQQLAWHIHKNLFGEGAPFAVVDGRQFEKQWGDLMLDAGNSQEPHPPGFHSNSLFELAEGGTLLIQEINHISPRAQLILAQSLQTQPAKCFVVGTLEGDSEKADSELVPELRQCFSQTYTIRPLRERKRDITAITQGVLAKLAQKHNRPAPVINTEALKLLLSHNYRQGNVTELIQVIERAFFLAENNEIGLEHIFFGPTAEKIGSAINLLSWESIANVLRHGQLVQWMRRSTTFVFYLFVLILLLIPHSSIGVTVFAIVWGLWWPALAIISPILGRTWCTVCPFAQIMELVQKKFHLNRPVPDVLKKYDYLFVTFLFPLIIYIETFSDMRAHPGYTVILLFCIQAAALVTGMIYTRQTWCRHLCPLGGFIGLASIGAMLEVRSDPTVCLNKCTTHECYVGTDKLAGCPMSQHLPYLDNNLGCKMCFHCVRNCPNDAVQFNLRVPAREVWHLVRVNQGYAIFTGVALAMIIPVYYFDQLRATWPQDQWQLWFSVTYWVTVIAAAVLSRFIAQPFKTKGASKRIKLMFAFIPLVIAGHIVYQLYFVPGGRSLLLGLGWQGAGGVGQGFYVPAYEAAQILAIAVGFLLTVSSVFMVIWTSRSKKTAIAETSAQGLPHDGVPVSH